MNREQQEMSLWCEAYMLAISQGASYGDADEAATTAAESFRKRYPVEPSTPPGMTWYYEPPFAKDGKSYPCWVAGWGINCTTVVAELYWHDDDWRMQIVGSESQYLLAGRRVSPIVKPPESKK